MSRPRNGFAITHAQGELDEIFVSGARVHVERMNETGFWIGIDGPKGKRIMINTGTVDGEWFFNVTEDWQGGTNHSVTRKLTDAQIRKLWASRNGARQTPHAGPGRPRTAKRCACGLMTAARAQARGHRCGEEQ